MKEPSALAQENMNAARDDTSWVYVPSTQEKWVQAIWDDPVEWTDTHGRGWYHEDLPDPRKG